MFIENLRTEFSRPAVLAHPASWLLLAVAAYVFLAPNIDFAPHLTWHDGQRLAQLVLFGVVAVGLVVPGVANAVSSIWAALPGWNRMAWLAAFALGLVSAVQAPLERWALLEWAMLLLLLVVVLGVAAGRRAGGFALDRVLMMIVYATAVAYISKTVVVYVAMLTVGATYGQGFNVRELFTGFSNIRFFGHVQTLLLPFLLLPALCWVARLRYRLLLGIVPALWWMLVVASGTRGTWVALLIGVLVVLAFGGQTGRRWIKWQIAGLACGLLCYAVFVLLVPNLMDQPASFLHRTEDIITLSGREVIWTAALSYTSEHPWLGIGPMHFAYFTNAVAAHPHNAILQFMAEWGVPAALLFTVVFAAGGLAFAGRVRQVVASADVQTGMIAVALLAALAGGAAQAMVDGMLVMPVSQIVLALICGWALGFYLMGHSSIAPCGVVEKRLAAAIIILALGCVVYGVQPEIGHLEQREEQYLALPDTRLLPRFWAQGWINE